MPIGPGLGAAFRQASLLDSSPGAGAGSGAGTDFSGLESFGSVMSIAGAVTGAIGAFYQAKSQQNDLESQALSFDFASRMADINARAAEADAHAAMEAGRRDRLLVTLRHGAIKEAERAGFGARGLQIGPGTSGEVLASQELAKEIDALTIDSNAYRAAQAARRRAVNFRTEGDLAAVSASNARGLKGSINPVLGGITSLLGGAARVGGEFARNKRLEALFGNR